MVVWFFRGGFVATPFKKNLEKRGDLGVNFFEIFFIIADKASVFLLILICS